MSRGFCQWCGHPLPSGERGMTSCPRCGGPNHADDELRCTNCGGLSPSGTSFCIACGASLFKLCTACGKRGPIAAAFCGECGGSMWSTEDATVAKEAQKLHAARRARGKTLRTLGLTATSVLMAWFLCITPVINLVGREAVIWDTMVQRDTMVESAPRLSQAQIQATQQAEIATRTIPFEDIEVRIGEILGLEKSAPMDYLGGNSYKEDLFANFTVVVENRGDVAHEVLLAYRQPGRGYAYESLVVDPRSQVSFEVEERVGHAMSPLGPGYTDVYWSTSLEVRLESVDGILREDTSLREQYSDFGLRLDGIEEYERYVYVGE